MVARCLGTLFGVFSCVGVLAAHDADVAGSYEILVCKTGCAFGDSQAPAALGTVVLFDAPLSTSDVVDIDPFHFGTPDETLRACFSGMQYENAETLAFGSKRGVSGWEYKHNQLTFQLLRSIDAGYEATLQREGELLRGTGTSWGAGEAAPGYRPDVIVARRVGPPDISWCARSTTGFVDLRAADTEPVRKAVNEFIAGLTTGERREFLRASRSDLALLHFGAGSRVRERYFSSNSDVRQTFCGANRPAYCDIDAASMVIVEKVWQKLHANSDRNGAPETVSP